MSTKPNTLSEDILRMTHAFSDAERKQGVRELAARADALENEDRNSRGLLQTLARMCRGLAVEENDRLQAETVLGNRVLVDAAELRELNMARDTLEGALAQIKAQQSMLDSYQQDLAAVTALLAQTHATLDRVCPYAYRHEGDLRERTTTALEKVLG